MCTLLHSYCKDKPNHFHNIYRFAWNRQVLAHLHFQKTNQTWFRHLDYVWTNMFLALFLCLLRPGTSRINGFSTHNHFYRTRILFSVVCTWLHKASSHSCGNTCQHHSRYHQHSYHFSDDRGRLFLCSLLTCSCNLSSRLFQGRDLAKEPRLPYNKLNSSYLKWNWSLSLSLMVVGYQTPKGCMSSRPSRRIPLTATQMDKT